MAVSKTRCFHGRTVAGTQDLLEVAPQSLCAQSGSLSIIDIAYSGMGLGFQVVTAGLAAVANLSAFYVMNRHALIYAFAARSLCDAWIVCEWDSWNKTNPNVTSTGCPQAQQKALTREVDACLDCL